jgi:sortase A
MYVFWPMISWQIYIAPLVTNAALASPIPQSTILTPSVIQSLEASGTTSLLGDRRLTSARNWFPAYPRQQTSGGVQSYTLSIPSIGLEDKEVSTISEDLTKHLVHLSGTSIPPMIGNAVIFGHSTLPQLYNPNDYTTVFARIHDIKRGDAIIIDLDDVSYTYRVISITVVEPDDTSVLAHSMDDSYLTIVTCTPPGTIWKRLIVRARLQTL